MSANGLERLLNESIAYEIKDGVLEITKYYDSRKKIVLDLRKIDNDMLEVLQVD